MKITTKGRYALRIMLELASIKDDKLLTVGELAGKTKISEKYLEQIIGKLTKAKLLFSQRGSNGGYKLARSTMQISVGEILNATEGNIKTVSCMENGNNCARFEKCLTVNVWAGLNKVISDYLNSVSLYDVLNKQITLSKSVKHKKIKTRE